MKTKNTTLTLFEDVYVILEAQGMDEHYGARPLRSTFQRPITRPLSHKLLQGKLPEAPLLAKGENGSVSFQQGFSN